VQYAWLSFVAPASETVEVSDVTILSPANSIDNREMINLVPFANSQTNSRSRATTERPLRMFWAIDRNLKSFANWGAT